MVSKQRITTRINEFHFEKLKEIAAKERRSLQSVVEEALVDLIKKKSGERSRPEVIAHYEATVSQFDSLFERLA